MARSRSIVRFSGTIGGVTHVDSATYGPHTRAPRGTHKAALLNEAMQESTKVQRLANRYGKLINDQINLFRDDIKGGQFWQNLLSVLRHQYKTHGDWEPNNLKGIEIHAKYPLSKICKNCFAFSATVRSNRLGVYLEFYGQPTFRSTRIDGYEICLFAIFPDYKNGTSESVELLTERFSLAAKPGALRRDVLMPHNSKRYLIGMRVRGCVAGIIDSSPSTKGIQILDARRIETL